MRKADDELPVASIAPAPRGRVTGFALTCSCGAAGSKLAASRRLALFAAEGHLRADHGGMGRIAERRRPC